MTISTRHFYPWTLLESLFLPKEINRIISSIKANHLTYLSKRSLVDIAFDILALRKHGVPGDYIEAGVALGGSAILIGKLKPISSELHLFDTFTKIPEPSGVDGVDVQERYSVIVSGEAKGLGGNRYYGYETDLLSKVKLSFSEFEIVDKSNNIEFHKGLFSETMNQQGPVCFAHIDCDWYESVKYCLWNIAPRLTIGGLMVIDDYYDWSGCKKAVDEFISNFSEKRNLRVFHKTKLHIQRVF